jgi:hypothetical protein
MISIKKGDITMDTMQIIKKSWNLVWRYRALWLFGFLLALTVNNTFWLASLWDNEEGAVENRVIISNTMTIKMPGQGLTIDFRPPGGPVIRIEGLEPGWYRDLSKDARLSDVWALLITIGIVVLISVILSILFRYTSQAALIRMVDENERVDKMTAIGRGLRLGWSRVAGKLFLIDLLLTLAVILVFSLLFTLAISPFFIFALEGASENVALVVIVILLSLAGLLLFTSLAIAVAFLLSILRPVMYQACGVDGLGVWASIRQGFILLKTRFNQVIVTWHLWLAVKVGWAIAIIPVMIILSPLMLLTTLIGIVIGGVPALLATGVASLFVDPVFAWIIGAIFGLPFFLLETLAPIFFLSGLVEVFKSSFWTLSYREFRTLA